MVSFRVRLGLLFLVASLLSPLATMQAAGAAPSASAYELPPHLELKALAVGPSGQAFASTFHPLELAVDTPQGSYVFEISPTGEVKEYPAALPRILDGLAGIAAGPSDSVWLPTDRGVIELGADGIRREVSLRPAQVHDLATDRRGGVWVLDGHRVFHIGANARARRLKLSSLHLEGGCCAYPARSVVDVRGNLWMAIVRGGGQLTREVVERMSDGRLRTFRVKTRFGYPEAIGVSSGMPVVQSGRRFLRLDPGTGRFRPLALPERSCFLTESTGVWCRTTKVLYRAFPRGDPSPVSLPGRGSILGQLASGPAGQLWYGAEEGRPCADGPNGCSVPSRAILIGQVPGMGG